MPDSTLSTVLVVDDDDVSLELVSRRLGSDYQVIRARCGREALDKLAEYPVDLVLMDVMMPDLDGFEACRRMKSGNREGFLPVILLTALDGQEERNVGLAAGADEFLSKPVDTRELLLRVRALLKIRDQERTIRDQARSLEQANLRLQVVNRMGMLLAAELERGDLRASACRLIAEQFGYDLVAIGVPGGEGRVEAVEPAESRDEADALLRHPVATRSMEFGEIQVDTVEPGSKACWSPIGDRQGTLGMLIAHSRMPHAFGNIEARAIVTVSLQLSMALRNEDFVRKIRAHSDELESAVHERTLDLRRQYLFNRQIIDSLPVSLYVVNRELTVVAWNRRRELGNFGVPRDEALGRNLLDLFQSRPAEEIEGEFADVFRTGKSTCLDSESVSQGERRFYRIHKIPMFLEPGNVTHVLTIGEDVTERRKLQESMATADKMVAMGRLAAGVAHEVNNPLATIVTCAEGLQARLEDLPADAANREEFLEYLEIVQQEAFRAKRISEDLLDFSRAEPPVRVPRQLDAIIERTLTVLKHHAGFKRIDLERDFSPDLPDVEVDEDAVVQVLVALILNAIDAMPAGGRLCLATAAGGDEVRCAVRDSGDGIREEDLPRIFEPFFTTKAPGRGTGLGLAVCFGIVQSLGGRIEVESRPGEGSCFTVVLPAARHAARAAEEAV